MEASEQRSTNVDERRTATRRPIQAQVNVTLEPGTVRGAAEDISAAGVLFFSSDQVRVSVEVVEDGRTASFTGRLVRVESLSDTSSGFAIEFDRP